MDLKRLLSAGTLLGLSHAETYIIAVVGCGGKTTLIESIADEYNHKKVLITPTTKIFPMNRKDVIQKTTIKECLAYKPSCGIHCFGSLNRTTGKLEAFPSELLEEIIPQYDIVLLEADGSQELPCKGWLSHEPVIPKYCTHTIGVLTMHALGKPSNRNSVLHLPEFSKLTGLNEGEIITLQALTDMVCAYGGMLCNGVGRQSIFINQIEDDETAEIAKIWLMNIQSTFPERFSNLAYGNAHTNSWVEVLSC